ncbi:Gfo/Idh/MocA family oxidoreductase [Geodermatophilus sp. YIM 151500]|uniref:Gfo/Idh/MocA family protein n=1 Tax=Geodermatophilus sp. YIM 151500 TaxID=2984531 RepID=UPI0021E4926B|nr:Gfo/Idh/MocA family oxidoreductase [Geodermatophilus sp. YIM 151500]MCV2488857.1 Gfo/Idh/MocA family oxidoreductase [Geodermatophilus sp. YIM 151500]
MTDDDRIGWGLVGLGRIADTEIAPAIAASANGALAGVVSRDAAKAEDFAGRHGAAAAYDDYRALLEDPAVDAVYVATPNGLHADQVVAAAEAGKHVLCDKPLATTVADAERAVAACAAAGVRLGVTFQTRNHEGMREIRDLLAAGGIGSVRLAQVELGPGRMLPQNWRTDPEMAGAGVMNNLGVHAYDLLRYLLGSEVVEATAVVDVEPGFRVDTLALALLRFENGALAYVNANQSLPNPQQNLSICGTEGTVLGRNVTRPNLAGSISVIGRDGTTERAVSSTGAFLATVENFADAVLHGREPSPSGVDGLRSVELTEALARSARDRRPVAVGG